MNRPREFLLWAADTFGPVALNRDERCARFIEEAIELAHAAGLPLGTLSRIAERVYDRPPGKLDREIGQAQCTLEMFAHNEGLNSADEASREFDRVRAISKQEWHARHAAKAKLGIANLTPATSGADQ